MRMSNYTHKNTSQDGKGEWAAGYGRPPHFDSRMPSHDLDRERERDDARPGWMDAGRDGGREACREGGRDGEHGGWPEDSWPGAREDA